MIDGTGQKTGIPAAIEAIGEVGRAPDEMAADQPDFFMLSPASSGAQAQKFGARPAGSGKAGRPPGAKNKSTEAWRDYLLSRYTSPLLAMAEIATRPPRDLAYELGCTIVEAFKIQIVCLRELAPYLHSKMPIAVDAGPNGLISLSIHGFNQPEQNQGLMPFPAKVLDSDMLDSIDKDYKDQQLNPVTAPDILSDALEAEND